MNTDRLDVTEHEERLNRVLAAYVEAVEFGQTPEPEVGLAQHPDLGDELREFIAARQQMASWTAPLRQIRLDTSAPAPKDHAASLAGLTFGDYELLEEVGRGGMGIVYKARQRSAPRLVALKVLRAGRLASPADRRRFRLEIEAIAHLDHPHIVP